MQVDNCFRIVQVRTTGVMACFYITAAAVIVLTVHVLEIDASSSDHVLVFDEKV